MRAAFKKTVGFLNSAIDLLASIGMMFTFILVLINVAGRYVTYLGSLSWSEEGARFMFILVCCLGMVEVTRNNDHFKVRMFIDKLPFVPGKILLTVSNLITMALLAFLTIGGMRMIETTIDKKSAALGFPTWILYGLLVFSAVCMFLSMIGVTVRDITAKKTEALPEENAEKEEND